GYATNHMTPPLRDIKPIPPEKKGGKSEANEQANENPPVPVGGHKDQPDPVVQRAIHPFGALVANMPAPLITWDGIDSANGCGGCTPPDTNGAVGPSHYVQMVNTTFQIWTKTG